MTDSHDENELAYQRWLDQRRQPPDIDVSDAVLAELQCRGDKGREPSEAGPTLAPRMPWMGACARFAAISGAVLIGILRLSWFLLPLTELR